MQTIQIRKLCYGRVRTVRNEGWMSSSSHKISKFLHFTFCLKKYMYIHRLLWIGPQNLIAKFNNVQRIRKIQMARTRLQRFRKFRSSQSMYFLIFIWSLDLLSMWMLKSTKINVKPTRPHDNMCNIHETQNGI